MIICVWVDKSETNTIELQQSVKTTSSASSNPSVKPAVSDRRLVSLFNLSAGLRTTTNEKKIRKCFNIKIGRRNLFESSFFFRKMVWNQPDNHDLNLEIRSKFERRMIGKWELFSCFRRLFFILEINNGASSYHDHQIRNSNSFLTFFFESFKRNKLDIE